MLDHCAIRPLKNPSKTFVLTSETSAPASIGAVMSMPPEITPEARRSKVASSLTAFLEAIHCAKIDSRWIMLLCDNNDRPERVEIPDDRTIDTYAVLTK